MEPCRAMRTSTYSTQAKYAAFPHEQPVSGKVEKKKKLIKTALSLLEQTKHCSFSSSLTSTSHILMWARSPATPDHAHLAPSHPWLTHTVML